MNTTVLSLWFPARDVNSFTLRHVTVEGGTLRHVTVEGGTLRHVTVEGGTFPLRNVLFLV